MSNASRNAAPSVPEGPPEHKDSLWLLTFSPIMWAAHFVASYVTAAVWCAKVAGRDGSLLPVRLAIVSYTLVAIAGIAWTAWRAYKQQAFGTRRTPRTLVGEPHAEDTATHRHRFLGFATLLLSGLSGAAVLFVALSVVFMDSCR